VNYPFNGESLTMEVNVAIFIKCDFTEIVLIIC